jgi:peptidoglycan DL-endopeptidase CwlO
VAEVRALEAQLNQLGAAEEVAVQAWDGAQLHLREAQARIRANTIVLNRARRDHHRAQNLLAARLVALYRQPPPSLAEVILASGSISAISGRIDVMRRLEQQDNAVVSELAALKHRMAVVRVALIADRGRATAALRQATIQRRKIEAVLVERRNLLANSQAELRVLIVQEERRQAILAAQARARMIAYQAAQQRAAQVRAAQASPQASPQPSSAGQAAAPVAGGAVAAPSGSGAVSLPSASGAGSSAAPAPTSGSAGAPGSGSGSAVVNYALQFLGTPYKWGGSSPGGFDCSGFTSYVYSKFGVNLQHYTGAQVKEGTPVSRNDLQPGDLVFFNGDSHEGLYIGGGKFIHAPHTGDSVKISSLSDSWYSSGYDGAVRP